MQAEYVAPFVLGVVVYYFAEDFVTARRFGPVTDGARSSETGGLAFRLAGLVLVGVGITRFLQMHAPW